MNKRQLRRAVWLLIGAEARQWAGECPDDMADEEFQQFCDELKTVAMEILARHGGDAKQLMTTGDCVIEAKKRR